MCIRDRPCALACRNRPRPSSSGSTCSATAPMPKWTLQAAAGKHLGIDRPAAWCSERTGPRRTCCTPA
eukprot:9014894-Alexandrium_andersonii.AAC.1